MRVGMPGLLALEIALRAEEVKDSLGTYKPTGKYVPHIVLFAFGQNVKFGAPETIMMRLPDEQVQAVEKMLGTTVTCFADQRQGKKGHYYVFEKIEPATA